LLEIVLLAWRYAWHGLCYRLMSVCHILECWVLSDVMMLQKFKGYHPSESATYNYSYSDIQKPDSCCRCWRYY